MTQTHSKQLVLALAVLAATALVASVRAADEAPKRNIGGVEGDGAVIKGIIKYEGKTPPAAQVKVQQDPFCINARANKPLFAETWVFGKNGDSVTLANTFVYISKGLEGKTFDVPKAPVLIDQIDCQYTPHVSAAMAKQKVDIRNSDATLHNVQAFPKINTPPFNDGMPVKGMVLNKSFAKQELGIRLSCAVHPWMNSILHVMDHPFFAIVGEDGTFELRGVPDGTYTIETWHEFKRFAPNKESVTVVVKDGKADTNVEITYGVKP